MAKSDLISREDAIKAVGDWMQKEYGYLDLNRAERFIDALSALPSADAVSREDYEKIKNMVSTQFQTVLEDYLELEKRYVALLGKQSQKPSAEAVQGWIPCSERLPNDSGDYLVWLEDESEHYAVIPFDADAEGFGWWQDYYHPVSLGFLDSEFIKAENVTAWQPLPKPYREDGEE